MHGVSRPGLAATILVVLATADLGLAVTCAAVELEPPGAQHTTLMEGSDLAGSAIHPPRTGYGAPLAIVGLVSIASAAGLFFAAHRVAKVDSRG